MPTEPIVRYVEQLLYPIVLGISGFTIACCLISCVVAKKHERIRAGLRWLVNLGSLESDPSQAEQIGESGQDKARTTLLFALSCAAMLWVACFLFSVWAVIEFGPSTPIPKQAEHAIQLVMFAGAGLGGWWAYRTLLKQLGRDFSRAEISAAREEWQRRLWQLVKRV